MEQVRNGKKWTFDASRCYICSENDYEMKRLRLKFSIEQDEETGRFTASWNDPNGGGITTQADTLSELPTAIDDAVHCHFAGRQVLAKSSLHFERDPVFTISARPRRSAQLKFA